MTWLRYWNQVRPPRVVERTKFLRDDGTWTNPLEIVTPELYGAVGDGATNDAPALQAMFDTAGTVASGVPNTRPTVFHLTSGKRYRITSSLRISQSFVYLFGNGACIENAGTGPALIIDHNNSINSPQGVRVYNTQFTGGTGTGAHGIQVFSAPETHIEGCNFQNIGGSAIEGYGSVACRVFMNTVRVCGANGIVFQAGTKTYAGGPPVDIESQGTFIGNNLVRECAGIGIAHYEGGGAYITENVVEVNATRGISIESVFNFTLLNNYMERNGLLDILIDTVPRLFVTRTTEGGLIIGNKTGGEPNPTTPTSLQIQNASRIMVDGNRFGGTVNYVSTSGQISHGAGNYLLGTFTDNASSRLRLDSTSTGGKISGLRGLSTTKTPANNIAGTASITGAATTATVTFGTAEPDTSYNIYLTPAVSGGTPAAGSLRASAPIAQRATGSFRIDLEAAPGAGNTVAIDWLLLRK